MRVTAHRLDTFTILYVLTHACVDGPHDQIIGLNDVGPSMVMTTLGTNVTHVRWGCAATRCRIAH